MRYGLYVFCVVLLAIVCIPLWSASVTSLIIPQFIQGNQPTNNDRVHTVALLKLDGLNSSSTYRYYTMVVTSSDSPTTNGAGVLMFFPSTGNWYRSTTASMSTVGQYGEFTTDATGSYTGWFGVEPSGNSRFNPGNQLYLRIMLNNGAGGTTVATRLTTSEYMTVVNWGTSSSGCTFVFGNWGSSEKKFVFLYDNASGTGRPISSCYTESDGLSLQSVSQISLLYRNNVDGKNGYYGTLVPNNLPNGIQRINIYNYNTTLDRYMSDSDGIWGSINTINPSGGLTTPIILSIQTTATMMSGTNSITLVEPLQAGQITFTQANVTLASNLSTNKSVSLMSTNVPGSFPNLSQSRGALKFILDYVGNVTMSVSYIGGEINNAYYFDGYSWVQAIDVINSPGVITFTFPLSPTKGDVMIVLAQEEPPLPVELSSFTASLTSQNFVKLMWTTQTETEMVGYYVFRNENNSIENALRVSPLIPATNSSTESNYAFVDQEVVNSAIYYYWLEMISLNNTIDFHGPISVNVTDGNGTIIPPEIQISTGITKVFPNPFHPNTQIEYYLKNDAHVSILIYNSKGQLIKTCEQNFKSNGLHKITWDGKDDKGILCSSGVYLIQMKTDKLISNRKIILMK